VWTIFRETAIACLEEVAGHRERATAIANRYRETTNVPFVAVVLAGILRRAGDPVTALHLLQNHSGYGDITYMSAATRATAALVHAKRGDMTSAHELCEAALDVAAPEGIRLPFCDGDLAMRQLLAAHLLRTTAHEEFIAECLALPRSGSPLEQLSERESDVFVLLQTAKTLTEIGDELGVSVNTVKSHQRAIYRKLGVNSRREARGIPF
jgi:LuxR family maltose regulon positive regulatory protein